MIAMVMDEALCELALVAATSPEPTRSELRQQIMVLAGCAEALERLEEEASLLVPRRAQRWPAWFWRAVEALLS